MIQFEQFEDIFKSHFKDLVAYAFGILKDQQDAEDIVQEVFFSLWKRKNSLAIESTIESYLFSAVKHGCMNRFRNEKVKTSYKNSIKPEDKLINMTPYNHLINKELESLIASSLADLPSKSLKIFNMNRYDQKKYREIAEEMSISLKTVEAHISRVLKHLRLKLDRYMIIVFIILVF